MVKIPGLDELKKIGSDLVNSAKNINVDGMVEKIKTQVETMSNKVNANSEKAAFDKINHGINELLKLQPNQADTLKKIQSDVAALQRSVEAENMTK